MFSKILVANRGEIACRIIRTCQKMGIRTVAVYSEADRDTLHVKMADEGYLLGAPAPAESYLNISRIIALAQTAGAEAIHPGYGFLAESPIFARACQKADIRFIGPYPYVMENMEDKVRARKLARDAGIPILPGTDTTVEDAQATSAAWELGFPLMVKAAQGGGGIGIRIINSPEDLKSVIQQQRVLVTSAFGSSLLYFERYLPGASHIEVQIIGDEHGNLVHLFERDCSVQRRNQKLVEESPAIKLTPEQREKVWGYALKLARHIGYTNAGTVEFLVSPDGDIFFLEMNTRLQVEHGVTEMITGLDLVELQLRVSAGERLPITADDVKANGHAIEVRIYPEDSSTFLPSAGKIRDFRLPSGDHIRVETALSPGYEVTIYYEPLVAKLIAWGQDREEARLRLVDTLGSFRIYGVKSNVQALNNALTSPSFVDGSYHTGFVSSLAGTVAGDAQNGFASPENRRKDKELAAAIGVSLLMAANGNGMASPRHRGQEPDPWKLYGRREQMLSRKMGSRGWR